MPEIQAPTLAPSQQDAPSVDQAPVPATTVGQTPTTVAVPVTPAPVSATPHPKVVAAGLAGAVTTIVLFVATEVFHLTVPGDVAGALTTIFAVVAGYLTSSN